MKPWFMSPAPVATGWRCAVGDGWRFWMIRILPDKPMLLLSLCWWWWWWWWWVVGGGWWVVVGGGGWWWWWCNLWMPSWPPEWGREISTNEAWILGPLIVRHVSIVWLDNPSTMTADQSESAFVWREFLGFGSRPLVLFQWVHPEFRSMVRRFPLFQRSPCWFLNVFNHMVWWKKPILAIWISSDGYFMLFHMENWKVSLISAGWFIYRTLCQVSVTHSAAPAQTSECLWMLPEEVPEGGGAAKLGSLLVKHVKKYVAASRNVRRYEKVFRIFSEEQKRYEETPPNAISEACQSNPRIRWFDKCTRVFPPSSHSKPPGVCTVLYSGMPVLHLSIFI